MPTGTGVLLGAPAPVSVTRGRPMVFVSGPWWNASAERAALTPGTPVHVADVDGLDLVVAPSSPDPISQEPT